MNILPPNPLPLALEFLTFKMSGKINATAKTRNNVLVNFIFSSYSLKVNMIPVAKSNTGTNAKRNSFTCSYRICRLIWQGI